MSLRRFCRLLGASLVGLASLLLFAGCAAPRQATPALQHSPTPAVETAPTAASPATPAPALQHSPTPAAATPEKNLSTPELIDAAYQQQTITAGQRWLYLAYAIYDYPALPAEYRSPVRWDATLYLRDLKRTAASAQSLCALEPEVQAELRRLLPGSASCPP